MTQEELGIVGDFLHKCTQMPGEAVILGIDPGTTGAIALVCGKQCVVVDIPVTVVESSRTKKTTEKEFAATGKKTKKVMTSQFDLAGISELFRLIRVVKDRLTVGLEHPSTSLGPGRHHAELMLSRAYAMWPLFLHYNGYQVEEVRPSVWKGAMGLLEKKKEHSRLKALSLFPKADIKRKMDHDRAEAILLCVYIQRKLKGA